MTPIIVNAWDIKLNSTPVAAKAQRLMKRGELGGVSWEGKRSNPAESDRYLGFSFGVAELMAEIRLKSRVGAIHELPLSPEKLQVI